MNSQNTILIGLDGLDWGEIDPWIQSKCLSNIGDLVEQNGQLTLESTNPPWTPSAWPSLLSGRNPGSHGIFDFFTNEGYDKKLINRHDVDASYIHEALEKKGGTPLVVNFPVTHPAPKLKNGVLIPGYLASEDVEFSPPDIKAEYESEYGEYQIYPNYAGDDPVEEYTRVARHRRDIARFLDKRYDWDLLAVQFQVTDSIFHDLDDRDKIRQVLENVDKFVGDIIDLGGNDPHIFMASDHGMGDYEWTFYVNSWLSENGYCKTTTGDEQYFRQAKEELKAESNEQLDALVSTAVEKMASALWRIGLTPRRIHKGLQIIRLDKTVERLLPEDALVAAQNQVVDHENSIAYQLLFNSLGIHLNVKDREPSGQIAPDKYDEVRNQLMNEISKVTDPEGKLVFDDVLPRENVYQGQNLEDAPDIVLRPRDYQYDVSGSIVDTFRRNQHKNHKPEGILISNRNLRINSEDSTSIYDIAPTVAAALGIPIDSETDGKVLAPFEAEEEVDWDELASEYRAVMERELNTTDSVKDRLADLGYME